MHSVPQHAHIYLCGFEKWRDQRFNRRRQLRFDAREFLTAKETDEVGCGSEGEEIWGWEPLRFKTPLHPSGLSTDAPKTILNSRKSCAREGTPSPLILPSHRSCVLCEGRKFECDVFASGLNENPSILIDYLDKGALCNKFCLRHLLNSKKNVSLNLIDVLKETKI